MLLFPISVEHACERERVRTGVDHFVCVTSLRTLLWVCVRALVFVLIWRIIDMIPHILIWA